MSKKERDRERERDNPRNLISVKKNLSGEAEDEIFTFPKPPNQGHKQLPTECPKIYRKSVLHLLQYTANIHLSRCSRDLLHTSREQEQTGYRSKAIGK